jgi:hypothetical protein
MWGVADSNIPKRELVLYDAVEGTIVSRTTELGDLIIYDDDGARYVKVIDEDGNNVQSTYFLRQRSPDEIEKTWRELKEKVWHGRQGSLRELRAQSKQASGAERESIQRAIEAHKRIEATYPADDLIPKNDFERGLLWGRMSALGWALGLPWIASLDT